MQEEFLCLAVRIGEGDGLWKVKGLVKVMVYGRLKDW